ncbi:MAG: DUF1592 domain-containing protein [Verrucomicrobiales bacterium]|nr:DUF1592 domain-containing protein [Verrucomicrobiales bacterium]
MIRLPFNRSPKTPLAVAVTCSLVSLSPAFERNDLESFLGTHCYECHDDLTSEGDLNLLDLGYDADDTLNVKQWIQVLDRVDSGEMPPKEQPRPTTKEIEPFLALLQEPLLEAETARLADLGRGRVRRLNRSEFETTLSDLVSLPLNIQEQLPEDAKSHGFNTVGEALNVSSVQMEAYLDVLDQVFDKATTLYPEPKKRKLKLRHREEVGIMQVYRKGGPFHIQEDGVAFFATEKFSHLNAVISQYTSPFKARYKVKVSAYALRSEEPVILSLRAGGTGHAESNHVPHVFLEHFSLKEGEPEIFEWEGWLERGHYFHVYPTSLPAMRFAGKNEELRQDEYEGPAAVVQWVEVEGPFFDDWPPASHQALWDGIPTEPIPDIKPNEDPIDHLDEPPAKIAMPRLTRVEANKETGNRNVYDPKQGIGGEPIHQQASKPKPLHSTLRLAPEDPKRDSARLITSMASRAFRRDVDPAEVKPFIALAHKWMDQGVDFENAVRVGYKALFTSPGFLYHQSSLPDADMSLNPEALAERLAFFLWNGGPDKQLMKLAKSGNLSSPDALRSEVERLLNDEKSERFLKNFTDLWLDLRLIDFTVPDDKLYPEFDKLLEWSMLEETRAFVREMLNRDLSTNNLIDSDFTMANWRLAKHYGLPPVEGMEVRPVPLPDGSIRGGIMTQASILKVTANGTTTSPVVRGVWMLERIMGIMPDPPPPGIPAIEPDIRGAVSIRDQMEKHRNSASCASCHWKIDPPGMALESFDVIGQWRDHYRAINEELLEMRPRYSPFTAVPTRYIEGPLVDASYETAKGLKFNDVSEFKGILLNDPRQIARGVAEKLIIYSTGAEVSFTDRVELETILDRAEAKNFGLRTLIHEVIQSPLFHQK